jgi:hypothetical protein
MRRAALGALALLLAASAAGANGPEIGFDAGAIFPIESRNIQLVSETVDIHLPYPNVPLSGKEHNAICKYLLRNLSDSTQTFHMAFVSDDPPMPADTFEVNHEYLENDYQVLQDGKRCEVTFYRSREGEFSDLGSNQTLFPSWQLTIAPSASSVVEIRYGVSWSTGGEEGAGGYESFQYYARSAALWAGRIESADFRLHLPDKKILRNLQKGRDEVPWAIRVTPWGYRWTSDGLSWHFTNWEPDQDLRLLIESYGSIDADPSWNPWTPDSESVLPERTRGLDREPKLEAGQPCDDYRSKPRPTVSVHLRVHVNEKGSVDRVRYLDPWTWQLDGYPGQCAMSWRFHPAMKSGIAVPAWTDVTVRYPASK